MEPIVVQQRLVRALQRKLPSEADRVYEIGHEVLVYRETERQWKGPYDIIRVEGKIITISDRNPKPGLRPKPNYQQRFNTTALKPIIRDSPPQMPTRVLLKYFRQRSPVSSPEIIPLQSLTIEFMLLKFLNLVINRRVCSDLLFGKNQRPRRIGNLESRA